MRTKQTGIPVKLAASLLCAVMLLCGCDSEQAEKEVTTDKPFGNTITGELLISDDAETVSDYPVTVNDTVIEKAPQRVICLSSSLTEIIYELGHSDKLVGRGTYCSYPEEAASLPDYGKPASPDLGAVKESAPDMLITATSIPSKDVTALSDIGITVLYIPSPRSVEEYGRIYCALGMVFEGLFEGENTGNEIFGRIKDKLTAEDIGLGSFIYVTEEGAIAGGDTFESSVLSLWGENAAKELSGYVLGESLPSEVEPDVIILNRDVPKDVLLSDSRLSSLGAVTSDHVITVSNSYFESPSGRITGIVDELKGENDEA